MTYQELLDVIKPYNLIQQEKTCGWNSKKIKAVSFLTADAHPIIFYSYVNHRVHFIPYNKDESYSVSNFQEWNHKVQLLKKLKIDECRCFIQEALKKSKQAQFENKMQSLDEDFETTDSIEK